MLILAFAFIALTFLPIIVEVSSATQRALNVFDWLIWGAFAAEYLIRLYLAPHKRVFVRHNLVDLAVVVVPFLRPLRVVRSARALPLLRAGRVTLMGRGGKSTKNVRTRHKLPVVGSTRASDTKTGRLAPPSVPRSSLQDPEPS